MLRKADKLTEGTKELFKRYPETMRLDVYPTHRTVALPQRILDNTVKNATGAKTDGVALENVLPGYPFLVALLSPSEHAFVKPSFDEKQAAVLGFDLGYDRLPTAAVYGRMVGLAEQSHGVP